MIAGPDQTFDHQLVNHARLVLYLAAESIILHGWPHVPCRSLEELERAHQLLAGTRARLQATAHVLNKCSAPQQASTDAVSEHAEEA